MGVSQHVSHCDAFDAYRSCENADITFLLCYVKSRDHHIKEACDLIKKEYINPSYHSDKFDTFRSCGSEDIVISRELAT